MKRLFVVIAALTLLASFNIRAEEHKEPKSRRETFVSQRILDKLSPTAEQRAQVKELRDKFGKEADDWRAAHKAEREELRKQKEAATAAGDKAKIEELEKKWNDHFKPLRDLRQQYLDKLRAVLTDDQKKTLKDELEHAKQRWAERTGHGEKEHEEDKDDKD
jgi:Spy/CpxP family protein refolding chaperone